MTPLPTAPISAVFSPLGDHAVTVTVGDSIDETTHRRVRAISAALDAREIAGIVDQVPAFASLVVHYEPERVGGDAAESPYQRLVGMLTEVLAHVGDETLPTPRTTEIPVCYGGDLGPDLPQVAAFARMSADEVVQRHASATYRVFMLGFVPGFAYLGMVDPDIAMPRRATPRVRVPMGSVGIAGVQTGIYPAETPGGWQLIGQTPVRPFDPRRDDPFLMKAGDAVQFYAIERAEFDRLKAAS